MTDATQRGEAEAVEAAERLLPKSFVRNYRGNIGAAIAAAYPVIAAAVREQVALEIEAIYNHDSGEEAEATPDWWDGFVCAADVAREGK